MVGLRCFDSNPFIFKDIVHDPHGKYTEHPDSVNSGFIREANPGEAVKILEEYYSETWPNHWKAIQKEGAVF